MEERTSIASHDSPSSGREVPREVTESAVSSGGGSAATDTETGMKRKRGRPRKHDHADHVDTESSPVSPPPLALVSSSFSVNSSTKRRRGRPKGTGKLQVLASLGGYFAETAGGNFSPCVVTVKPGEDIAGKVISFLQRPPRAALCILSAAGMVSRVVIRQPDSPGGILTFEGCFEILSLSGSFRYGEVGSTRRVAGILSISLAKPDGQVFGGVLGGSLVADSPIQLIVATFKQNIIKQLKRRNSSDSSTAASRLGDSEMVQIPIDIARMTDDNENCTTPTNVPPKLAHEEVDTVISENKKLGPASAYNVGENVLQVWQPISEQRTSTDTKNTKDQNSSPASMHSVDEINLPVWQPIADQRTSPNTKNTKDQNLSPTSMHSVDENALQFWQPISDKGASPNSVTAENQNSSPASPPSVGENALQVLQPISEPETSPNMAIAENKSTSPTSHSISEDALQVCQPISDQRTSPKTHIAENQISGLVSPHNVVENTLQVQQSIPNERKSPDTNNTESQNSSPASPHWVTVGENAMPCRFGSLLLDQSTSPHINENILEK